MLKLLKVLAIRPSIDFNYTYLHEPFVLLTGGNVAVMKQTNKHVDITNYMNFNSYFKNLHHTLYIVPVQHPKTIYIQHKNSRNN
jgi:hypothetical protein